MLQQTDQDHENFPTPKRYREKDEYEDEQETERGNNSERGYKFQ